MNERQCRVASLCVNLLIVVLEIIGMVISLARMGVGLLQFYTQDSNLIAMAACLALAVQQLLYLRGRRGAPARWALVFKYVAVSLLMVTFLVVVFVLAPSFGKSGYSVMLFDGAMLYHHTLCPLLALLSFLLFERQGILVRRDALTALIPTALYALVTLTLNLLRVMDGPYPFLKVYEQPIYMSIVWFIVILGGAYAIARLIRWVHNKTPMGKKA